MKLKAFHVVFVAVLCLLLTGCGPEWKRKFVRKKNVTQADQVFVYEAKEYQQEPNSEMYKRSFIFWKAWQEELVYRLGNNPAADIRAFEEALKNLDEMKRCLNNQKAAELDNYINKINTFFTEYKTESPDIIRSRQMRQELDRLMLKMDKVFRYSRVKEFIK